MINHLDSPIENHQYPHLFFPKEEKFLKTDAGDLIIPYNYFWYKLKEVVLDNSEV